MKQSISLALVSFAALIVTSCGGDPQMEAANNVQTEAPTNADASADSPLPTLSPTPEPTLPPNVTPTATPSPTASPTPSPTPIPSSQLPDPKVAGGSDVGQVWTGADLICFRHIGYPGYVVFCASTAFPVYIQLNEQLIWTTRVTGGVAQGRVAIALVNLNQYGAVCLTLEQTIMNNATIPPEESNRFSDPVCGSITNRVGNLL